MLNNNKLPPIRKKKTTKLIQSQSGNESTVDQSTGSFEKQIKRNTSAIALGPSHLEKIFLSFWCDGHFLLI